MSKKKIVEYLLSKGFLLSPDSLDLIDENFNPEFFLKRLKEKFGDRVPKVITKEIIEKVKFEKEEKEVVKKLEIKKEDKKISLLKFIEKKEKKVERGYEFSKEVEIKEKVEVKKVEPEIIIPKKRRISEETELAVDVLKNFKDTNENPTLRTWVSYYNARLKKLSKILKMHREVSDIVSIGIASKKNNEEVSIVGLVYEKTIGWDGSIRIILEDRTGKIKAVIRKDSEIYESAKNVLEDSVVFVTGRIRRGILYPENIIFPDIPIKQQPKFEDDIYIAFTGDMQIGSKQFMRKEWELFIKWLKGEYGNEKMRELARKVGYLIIPGDLVDGVGIYPGQEEELEIKDIYKQYEYVEKTLLEIPENIKVIIIPGNHDAVRLAEPQPPISKEFLPELYRMDNFYLLSNPSYFYLHKIDSSKGILVLAYHGYSFDWLISNVEYIRKNAGYNVKRPHVILKYLLMLRHLAPTHGSTVYVPFSREDPLVIDPVPDIFVTGHIHKTDVGNYKGVDLINASCWQGPTPYQIELGHVPDPAKVILKNIRTGKFRILKFTGK